MLAKLLKYRILIPFGIVLMVVLIAQTNSFQTLNNNLYDYFLYLNRSEKLQSEIVIVEIDQKSINKINKWPWPRRIYSQIIDILDHQGAKVIGIYLQFVNPSTKEDDKLFISSLKKAPVVIIDSDFIHGDDKDPQFSSLIKSYTDQGHNIVPKDKDNVIRSQFILMNYKPSFAMALLQKYDPYKYNYMIDFESGESDSEPVTFKGKTFKTTSGTLLMPVNFKRMSDKIQSISFVNVLKGNYPEKFFKNKIVIVGFVVEGLHDAFTTAFSKQQQRGLPGTVSQPMVQAQIIDSLMYNDFIAKIPHLILYLLMLGIILVVYYFLRTQNIAKLALVCLLISPLMLIIVSYILLSNYSVWLAPFEIIFAFIFLFIAMSVNVVLNTSTFLDTLLGQLNIKKDIFDKSVSIGSIDDKCLNLAEAIMLIQQDKNVLDIVLSSVNSSIMLFDKYGIVVYSNNPKYSWKNFNISEISNDIKPEYIIKSVDDNNSFRQNIIIKDNHYEYYACKAKNNLYLGVLNDITDMVKMNEMKSNILRMLSHELKSPLASIMLCADTMKISDTKEAMEKYIDQITDQTEYVEKLILNFLSLNKLEVTDFELSIKETNLNVLINQVIEDLSIIANSKNIIVLFNEYSENLCVQADIEYLSIAIKNLIDNAIKYSPENTTIDIALNKEDSNINISIKDHGYGIPEEHIPKLFNKFYRVKNTNTEKGTGLGLSFVKRIIELHGGEITVTSEVEKGSEFIINLKS